MFKNERLRKFNNKKIKTNNYVLYSMTNTLRTNYNYSLEYAINTANYLEVPVVIYFNTDNINSDLNIRRRNFLFQGLKELQTELKNLNIKLIITNDINNQYLLELTKQASLLVIDYPYLKEEKLIVDDIIDNIDILVMAFESSTIVPIEKAGVKEEYSARTIRNKLNNQVPYYIKDFSLPALDTINSKLEFNYQEDELETEDIKMYYSGGRKEALKLLDDFIKNKLNNYEKLRNDPSLNYQSHLSSYLHFGFISAGEIYKKVVDLENSEVFLEELIVRRELSYNLVFYNQNYDSVKALPNWAINTLEEHNSDNRDYIYNLEELTNFKTHDIYWNAAQKEMVETGLMHGYMRMYWGKKIIEWTNSYQEAFEIMIYLNNRYSLDGNNPNSYTGVLWCFGKHDRPWTKRKIFGSVRYMNEAGLKRKFNMEQYLLKIAKIK